MVIHCNEERCEVVKENNTGESIEEQVEDGSELRSVFKYKIPTLISTKLFKEEVFSVAFSDETVSTVVTNFGPAVDKWVTRHKEGLVGLNLKTWKTDSHLELDMIQVCAGKECILYHTATAETPIPVTLRSMLKDKEVAVAAARDLLGEANKLYRGKDKDPFGDLLGDINWLNIPRQSRKLFKDKRILKGGFDALLESIVKSKFTMPSHLKIQRWDEALCPEYIFYATYEVYRAYQIGSRLLSA